MTVNATLLSVGVCILKVAKPAVDDTQARFVRIDRTVLLAAEVCRAFSSQNSPIETSVVTKTNKSLSPLAPY